MATTKLIPAVAPELTSLLNSKDSALWNENRVLSGFDIISFNNTTKTLTIGPGKFINNGVVVSEDSNKVFSGISGALLAAASVVDPVVLVALNTSNSETVSPTYSFKKLQTVVESQESIIVKTEDGLNWEVFNTASIGGILDEIEDVRNIVGIVPFYDVLAKIGGGSGFGEIKINTSSVDVKSVNFVNSENFFTVDSDSVPFDATTNFDDNATDVVGAGYSFDGGIVRATWYYIYGTSDGEIKFSIVPPVLGTRPAWIPGKVSYTIADTIQVLSTANKLKVTLNGITGTCTVPVATYDFRDLLSEIMEDSNWDIGKSPIRMFDYGSISSPSTRYVGAYGCFGDGVGQELKLETVSNPIYSTLGWGDFISVTRKGSDEPGTYIASVVNHSALSGLAPASLGGEIIYKGRAIGSASSATRAITFDDSTVFPYNLSLTSASSENNFLVPSNAKKVIIAISATSPVDIKITSDESQSDYNVSSVSYWSGMVFLPRDKKLVFLDPSIGSGETMDVFVVGYTE